MALKHKLESLEGLEENVAALYKAVDGGFVLDVEGMEPVDELKGAYERTKGKLKETKDRLAEIEAQKSADEEAKRQQLEDADNYKQLLELEQNKSKSAQTKLEALEQKIARRAVDDEVEAVVAGLTSDENRLRLLRREARDYVASTPEGALINGPEGEEWTREELAKYLAEQNSFLVDGSKATGGGASGGNSRPTVKKFTEYTSGELVELRKQSPAEYERIKNEHYGT